MLADFWVGPVFAITFPIGGPVGQGFAVWTTIADNAVEISIFQTLANRR